MRGARVLRCLFALVAALGLVACGSVRPIATANPGVPPTVSPSLAPTACPTAQPTATVGPVEPPTAQPTVPAASLPPTPLLTPGAGYPLPRFGVNYVYHGLDDALRHGETSPETYIAGQNAKLVALGVGWVRSAGPGDRTSLNWALVEPRRGVFDFTLHDLRVRDAQAHGLWMLGNVDFSRVPGYAQVSGSYFDDSAYLEYLSAVVERYDGDGTDDMPGLGSPILYWEIGNEVVVPKHFRGSADDYAHVLRISHAAIRASCPACVVLIGGWIVGKGEEEKWERSLAYFERVLGAGGGEAFDVMNYHEYALDYLRDTGEHVEGFRAALARYGLAKPIWITEANTRLDPALGLDATRQAWDVIKRPVVAFAAGVDVFMWHGLDDAPGGPGVGLFDENGAPKPAYYNYRLLVSSVDHFAAVERVDVGRETLHVYRFTVADGSVGVVWSDGEEVSVDLSAIFGSGDVRVTYALAEAGGAEYRTLTASATQVPIGPTPAVVTPD
jgi:hypothetical protein